MRKLDAKLQWGYDVIPHPYISHNTVLTNQIVAVWRILKNILKDI
jgi:hypothetical protein